MRPATCIALAALCLLWLGLRSSTHRARASGPAAGVAAARKANPTWEVKRYGETADDARDLALLTACDEVANYFRNNEPAIGDAAPSQETLLNKKVISLLDVPQATRLDNQDAFEAKVKVEITPKALEELIREARTGRMHNRHVLVAHLLAGVLALLLVTAGYLRLEDATRGYYTTLLRLAAGAVVTMVGVGLWLLR